MPCERYAKATGIDNEDAAFWLSNAWPGSLMKGGFYATGDKWLCIDAVHALLAGLNHASKWLCALNLQLFVFGKRVGVMTCNHKMIE